jgi:hypothetical protein
VSVRKHGGAFRNHGLPKHALVYGDVSACEPFSDRADHRFVEYQAEAEQLRGDFARHVIRRRSETACDQKDVAARKGIEQRPTNGRPVRNGRLSGNPKSERKKLLTEIGQVGICHTAEQQFGAGVKDFDVHREVALVFSRMLRLFCHPKEAARARGAAKETLPFSRKSLDPGVDSGVLVEVLPQIVNVKKICKHAQEDLPRGGGFQMRGAKLEILASQNFLAVRLC